VGDKIVVTYLGVDFKRGKCNCDMKVADSLIKSGYIGQRECAVLKMSLTPEEYLNPTDRKHRYWMKKKWKDAKKRYSFSSFDPKDHAKGMYAINTSMPVRCGREMADSYNRPAEELERVFGGFKLEECPFHWAKWFGAFDQGCFDNTLVAYILFRRIGNMGFYSMLLGHADHLKHGVVFGLHYYLYTLFRLLYRGVGLIMYGDWRDGTEGMQFWKKRCRFKPKVLLEVE